MKIYDILSNSAEKYSNNIALDHDGKRVTYKELKRNADYVKNFLNINGVTKNDNVAVLIDNSIEFVEAFFAINMCEAIILPTYVNTGRQKLINIFNFYDVKYLITFEKYNVLLNDSFFKDCPNLNGIFYFIDEKSVVFVENKEKGNDGSCASLGQDLSGVALMLFSSGTTNVPKGIMLTNNNIVSNVKAISDYLQLNPEDRILLIKNINHASSITGELLVGLYNGCTIYLTNRIPSSSLILEFIDSKQISILFAVPAILISMMGNKSFHKYNLNSLRLINFYGAVMPATIIEELAEKLPWVNLIYSYGLTEAAPRVTYILKDELLKRKKSSGIPIKDVEVSIIDGYGNKVSPGIVGEIVVKGPNVMKGYYKNTDLTRKALQNDELHTGDLGYFDMEGYLYVTGRKDNMIIISGKNVYPEEIETVIYSIKGVKEVLVASEYKNDNERTLKAFIVQEDGYSLDEENIFEFCRLNMEDYKVPREFVFVAGLDKTVSGKIKRNQDTP